MGREMSGAMAIYATCGVGHCWYVDPLARTLEV